MSKIRWETAKMEVTDKNEKFYTVKQAAEYLGIDYSSINKACHAKRINCSIIPSPTNHGNTFLISETALTEWYANRRERSPKAPSVDALTVEDLANEILKRVKGAYDEGYKQGRKDARSEFMDAFKGIR